MQLLCALAGLGLGLLLPRITTDATVASTRVTDALVAAGFGVLGLVTVIFSLLFLVVQWAFSSLSPRLNLFRDDPIVWRTFAFAVGVFVFSVTTALVIGDQQKVSVIVPAARGGGAAHRPRPDPEPAGQSVRLHSAGAHAVGHRRARPPDYRWCTASHDRLPRLPSCRRGAGRSCGRTARRSCSSSTWAGCCVPPTAP